MESPRTHLRKICRAWQIADGSARHAQQTRSERRADDKVSESTVITWVDNDIRPAAAKAYKRASFATGMHSRAFLLVLPPDAPINKLKTKGVVSTGKQLSQIEERECLKSLPRNAFFS